MAPASSSAPATSVQVAVRIRPTITHDTTSIPARFQRAVVHSIASNAVEIDPVSSAAPGAGPTPPPASTGVSNKKQTFTFDQVLPPDSTQHDMFITTAQPLLSRFLEGFNCTILAYGQTSSGKTFTMTGVDLDADPSDPHNGMGIIPRSVSTIFQRANQLRDERGPAWSYSIKGSFLELYNEDLIDLLCLDDASGGRREVQIREDKDGHIIWGGLREVSVRNANEVMSLIRSGSAIRRTNETDMNAQSSRSHAIFSLTLTQKKHVGGSLSSPASPRSGSPAPSPGGRSPSRLARPGSMYATSPVSRLSMPAGRPGTPGFSRGSGLRPASALGVHTALDKVVDEDQAGEWVTIVSKFHFVDLAGSERLKRTAAQGDRIKEGISINSGLLALGNVISALGDPSRAKSHMALHVPYRDSKLTRLLQDSLGGNAHTLMIACVSPAEWNAGETINTLKYANRARNIKNRAVVNEKEEGWEDVEWLQGMVTRLRKEMKSLKEGGTISALGNGEVVAPAPVEGAGKRVLQQMVELQSNYEDLRAKFVQRTEELTRLRRELGEKQRAPSRTGNTAKYEEIVGPVIEEYEKTISAMEAELSLNRAALRHTNELVEEKEEELSAIQERHASTELYVEELKARAAKLGEREASTEAYVRDLEEKLKHYDESSINSSGSITDLKREVARYRDTESHSSQYIVDLEARLARADESVVGLQQTVEQLESECERRSDEVRVLQTRLDTLLKDGEEWRTDLEKREQRVRELEVKLEEWERKKLEVNKERNRLSLVVEEVEYAKKSIDGSSRAPSPALTNGVDGESLTSAAETSPSQESTGVAETQLASLQETHAATLADLSSVTNKYRDALREISDLAAQIQELKLSNMNPDAPSPLLEKSGDPLTVPIRRRLTGESGRRLFFRHAASTESLHSRSLSQSLSLSQELSSAQSRNTSFSSTGTTSPRDSPRIRPNLSISLPSPNSESRSIPSLEKEIMRLQEVLKEREAEIGALEDSLRAKDERETSPSTPPSPHVNGKSVLSPQTMLQFNDIRKTMSNGINGYNDHDSSSTVGSVSEAADENLDRLNELMRSMAQKESRHREVVDGLTTELTQIRRQHEELTALSRDQALNMSSEMEGLRRSHAEDLVKLAEVENREAELLQTLDRNEAAHAAEVEQLRKDHEEALRAKEAEVDALIVRVNEEHSQALKAVHERLAAATMALEESHLAHTEAFGKLHADHEEELRARSEEARGILENAKAEHEAALAKAAAEHRAVLEQKEEEANLVLQRTEEEYYNALTKLRGDQALALETQAAEAASTLARMREEHEGELRMADKAREATLSESQSTTVTALKELQDEYTSAVSKKEAAFAEDVVKLKDDHSHALATRDEAHESAISQLKRDHAAAVAKFQDGATLEKEELQAALSESLQQHAASSARIREEGDAALQAVQERQAFVLQEIERGHEHEVEALKATHETAIAESRDQLEQFQESLAADHAQEVAKLRAEHQAAVADVNARLIALEQQHIQDLEDARAQHERDTAEEKERIQQLSVETEESFAKERDILRKDHDLLVQKLASQKASEEQVRSERDVLQRDYDSLLAESSSQQEATDGRVADHEALQKNYDALVEELASQKAIAEQHVSARDALQRDLVSTMQEAASRKAAVENSAQECSQLQKKQEELSAELAAHKAAAAEIATTRDSLRKSPDSVVDEKTTVIETLQKELRSTHESKDGLEVEVARLQAELERSQMDRMRFTQQAAENQSMVSEVAEVRAILATAQEELVKAREERNTLQVEKSKQDSQIRELEARLARSPSPSAHDALNLRSRSAFAPGKLPPPTPPPSVPPPPAPTGITTSTSNGGLPSPISTRESRADSPTSPTTSSMNGHAGPSDPKVAQKLAEQAKHIEEQETMIKTLNKQLTHCESDLQAHMDLVGTLEASLGDSEKNLRKARMHATELARERDQLNTQIDGLRRELTDTKMEVAHVRQSVVEEKQSIESRREEERKQQERTRAQLEHRMADLTKRKSKFVCL